ncbi:hypothetical protein AJ85_12815 [Alkalihalobacillus alcalophilus ATCC 27647 = CGMCC 1.3604]|uniref:DUF2777 domain-containing protein n=1 Tax=Alkalihalobacillus alcalophilus ATCC 27647 = CGMCC 1.3604 TaxID=1218173 RepID=A0A094WMT6_ALKAL|nr:DUF2777 family protein [Alkalihalobacillus alcalophilus]KGA99084.1 hypothetical protein BALCAV_0200055 [Alkalihalobacillus alcalophilus ATCC 27647 = CGMCC 1.3604]MED1562540.1 DUF2777 family protein [Alkalihalobacillus alcalophilus]THG90117.1 hypothetical protein AJ85_12815 [Alkalihalobacillus alcalophilus ATCC 27647 = CGMCC 1.3604]
MDRKEAQQLIGFTVQYTDQHKGTYLARLDDLILEPRKPFRGQITILALLSLPTLIVDKQQEAFYPLIKEGVSLECSGQSLEKTDFKNDLSYNESLLLAYENRIKQLSYNEDFFEIEFLNSKKQQLLTKCLAIRPTIELEDYIKYTFEERNEHFVLIDEHGGILDLDDCPFELMWQIDSTNYSGYYIGAGQFESNDKQMYSPIDGDWIFIHKDQFDPYMILRQELEPQVLEAFEKSLMSYGLTHDDLIECHNTLLRQLLSQEQTSDFSGTNFLTYKTNQGITMVLHHYDRKLKKGKEDIIYDRFEFTTENGKRSIFTYTNEYSV